MGVGGFTGVIFEDTFLRMTRVPMLVNSQEISGVITEKETNMFMLSKLQLGKNSLFFFLFSTFILLQNPNEIKDLFSLLRLSLLSYLSMLSLYILWRRGR